MYTEIGQVSAATVTELLALLEDLRWEHHVSDVTNHEAAGCMEQLQAVEEIVRLWPVESWQQLLFLRLGPGGKLHRHADEGFGFHIPVESNSEVISVCYDDGVRNEYLLEVGKVYHVDRSIEHESFNDGDTNRTHLIIVLKEDNNA